MGFFFFGFFFCASLGRVEFGDFFKAFFAQNLFFDGGSRAITEVDEVGELVVLEVFGGFCLEGVEGASDGRDSGLPEGFWDLGDAFAVVVECFGKSEVGEEDGGDVGDVVDDHRFGVDGAVLVGFGIVQVGGARRVGVFLGVPVQDDANRAVGVGEGEWVAVEDAEKGLEVVDEVLVVDGECSDVGTCFGAFDDFLEGDDDDLGATEFVEGESHLREDEFVASGLDDALKVCGQLLVDLLVSGVVGAYGVDFLSFGKGHDFILR